MFKVSACIAENPTNKESSSYHPTDQKASGEAVNVYRYYKNHDKYDDAHFLLLSSAANRGEELRHARDAVPRTVPTRVELVRQRGTTLQLWLTPKLFCVFPNHLFSFQRTLLTVAFFGKL